MKPHSWTVAETPDFFFAIALPLSKAIVAVIALYIAVNSWNSYLTP